MQVIIDVTEIEKPGCGKEKHQDENNIQFIIQPLTIHLIL